MKDIKFVIVGVGPDENKLLAKIKNLNLEDTVLYKGYMSDMKWFYSTIDCFALPSYWEGMAMVQLESMALGIPMICSDAPGLNDVPENGIDAIFVNAKSGNDLAEKIAILKNDRDMYDSISENAKKKMIDFSLEKYLKNLENLYSSF